MLNFPLIVFSEADCDAGMTRRFGSAQADGFRLEMRAETKVGPLRLASPELVDLSGFHPDGPVATVGHN